MPDGPFRKAYAKITHEPWSLFCVYKGSRKAHSGRTRRVFRKVRDFLIVTQEKLVKQIADKADMDAASVRKMFETAEELIFGCLSATTPSEQTVIKLMDGLSLECHYIPEKEIHTYDTIVCKPKIWVRPKITRYYNRKLNGYFDNPV